MLLPVTVAMSAIGLYSMVATLLVSRFAFGVDLPFEQPLLLAVALVATVVSIGALGFLLAVSFVRYRTAWALGNLLEYPVWLVAGFLVPITLLPDWVQPISWVLAPTWGVDAIREAASGGAPGAGDRSRVRARRPLRRDRDRGARERPAQRAQGGDARALMTSLRIFAIGGLISFRALFSFLRPEIYIPSMLVAPIFQILLFVYVGRSAALESDEFYVIGNAVQYAAVPCLFAMIFTVAGERFQKTLGYILVSPAARLPLFLGRAVPVMVNGFFVAAFSLVVGGLIVGIDIPAGAVRAAPPRDGDLHLLVHGLRADRRRASGCSCASRPCSPTSCSGSSSSSPAPTCRSTSFPAGCRRSRRCCRSRTGSRQRGRSPTARRSPTSAACSLTEAAIGVAYAALGFAFIRHAERLSLRHATLDRN